MEWQESFNIGIDVIDHQHRQILQYINTLEEIQGLFNEVTTQLNHPTMPQADLAASLEKVNRHFVELKVSPEQSTKVVDALKAMHSEVAALAPQ